MLDGDATACAGYKSDAFDLQTLDLQRAGIESDFLFKRATFDLESGAPILLAAV